MFKIFKLIASEDEVNEMEKKYTEGGYGYGHAKTHLLNLILELYSDERKLYSELIKNKDHLYNILEKDGLILVTVRNSYKDKNKETFDSYFKNNSKFKISEKKIEKNLYLSKPEPDILIRTGGMRRLSNFMLWQLSYTELFFLDKLWPDFNEKDLNKIINKDYIPKYLVYNSFSKGIYIINAIRFKNKLIVPVNLLIIMSKIRGNNSGKTVIELGTLHILLYGIIAVVILLNGLQYFFNINLYIMKQIRTYQSIINNIINTYLDTISNQLLKEKLAYSLSGGKRLRSMIVYELCLFYKINVESTHILILIVEFLASSFDIPTGRPWTLSLAYWAAP